MCELNQFRSDELLLFPESQGKNRLDAAFPFLNDAATRDAVMKSSKNEQLTDELIGEAILFLLKENAPINTLAFIARLQVMEGNEQNSQRRGMIAALVEEITHSHITPTSAQAGVAQKEWNKNIGDNVYPLFGNRQRQGRSKKH